MRPLAARSHRPASRLVPAVLAAVALIASSLVAGATTVSAQTRNSGTTIDLFAISITADQFDDFGTLWLGFHGPDFDLASLPTDPATGKPILDPFAAGAFTALTPGTLLNASSVTFTLPFDERYQTISFLATSFDGSAFAAGSQPWNDPATIPAIDATHTQVSFDIVRLPAGTNAEDTAPPTPPTEPAPTDPPTTEPEVPGPTRDQAAAQAAAEDVVDRLFVDQTEDPAVVAPLVEEPETVAGLLEVFRQTNLRLGLFNESSPVFGSTFIDDSTVDVEVGPIIDVRVVKNGDRWQLPTPSVCALIDFDDEIDLCTGDPLVPIEDPCQTVAENPSPELGGLFCDPASIGVSENPTDPPPDFPTDPDNPVDPLQDVIFGAIDDYNRLNAALISGSPTAPYLTEPDVVAGLMEVLRQTAQELNQSTVAVSATVIDEQNVDVTVGVAAGQVELGSARMVFNGTNWQLTTEGLCGLMNFAATAIAAPVYCTGDPLTPVDNPCELTGTNGILFCDPSQAQTEVDAVTTALQAVFSAPLGGAAHQTHVAEPEVVAELLPLIQVLTSVLSIDEVTLVSPTDASVLVSVSVFGIETTEVEMVQTNGVWQLTTTGLCGLFGPTDDVVCAGDPPRPVADPCGSGLVGGATSNDLCTLAILVGTIGPPVAD